MVSAHVPLAHRRLIKKGILHCDISHQNMMRTKRYTLNKDTGFAPPSTESFGDTVHSGDVSETSTTSAPTNMNTETDADRPPPGTLHRGILIDLDHASVSKDIDKTLAVGRRTVCPSLLVLAY